MNRKQKGIFLLMGALLVSGCGTNKFKQEVETETTAVKLARDTREAKYTLVTAEELKKKIDAEEPMVIIDAMPYDASYKKGHVPGAKQFLFPKDGEMTTWDKSKTDGKTEADYGELLEKLSGGDKEKTIVVYCGFTKCLRSHNAAIWAQKLGYTNVVRFPGGIYAWRGLGYPVESD